MAVGDVVGATYTSNTTFQPASGVSICITQFVTDAGNSNTEINFRGGINTNHGAYGSNGGTLLNVTAGWSSFVRKVFITNSNYIFFKAVSPYSAGFIGIQIA
tara:strand:- start:73 stop:378 length:306 start_codon:yes stop_codon:yes gene_type:complete